jgi:hypothetical protein
VPLAGRGVRRRRSRGRSCVRTFAGGVHEVVPLSGAAGNREPVRTRLSVASSNVPSARGESDLVAPVTRHGRDRHPRLTREDEFNLVRDLAVRRHPGTEAPDEHRDIRVFWNRAV